jgi:hypothetical protein
MLIFTHLTEFHDKHVGFQNCITGCSHSLNGTTLHWKESVVWHTNNVVTEAFKPMTVQESGRMDGGSGGVLYIVM